MATNLYMPKLGLTMEEGQIVKWYKKVGEPVRKGEALFEIATDKITNQMESPDDGVLLQIYVQEGDIAPVQAIIAVIGEANEEIKPISAPEEATENTAKCAAVDSGLSPAISKDRSDQERIFSSPAAKKLARELNMDLSAITGTGPGGRIREKDVQQSFNDMESIKISPLAAKIAMEHGISPAEVASTTESRIMKDDVIKYQASTYKAKEVKLEPTTNIGKPITGMRKIIAERMVKSWQMSPHVTLNTEVNMSSLVELKDNIYKKTSTKLSFTEFIVKAAAVALIEHKEVNRFLIDNYIYQLNTANIGVAVALDDGLIVPVVKDVQNKSILALRNEISRLSNNARSGALTADDTSGGTFTVTNLGMFGIDTFTPIINPPESAILGVGCIKERPMIREGELVDIPVMKICLSIDHRLIDGVPGAKFLQRIKEFLENPYLLI